ncbi:MAG: hydrolase [Thermodesulfovibrionales bacterium]|nr:hydrolase [Thermodesulfovibrionales bacterium]
MERFTLHPEDSVLIIIDIQERLAQVMAERERVINNCLHLIELSKLLNIPIVITEQYPKGLGSTVKEIREALPEYKPFEKLSFNCCSEKGFMEIIEGIKRKKMIITGMETHICVLQTCLGLLERGLYVHVVSDAVCSRSEENKKAGLEFMRDAGAAITCTETVLFQALRIAGTEEFRVISKRIK